jgi:ABC-type dipeptide/oligopeptide/nickel transport system permease component
VGLGVYTALNRHGWLSNVVMTTSLIGVSLPTFLIGVLLHLQRRKLESDRIADLEAILHDLQQRPKDAPTQPPR